MALRGPRPGRSSTLGREVARDLVLRAALPALALAAVNVAVGKMITGPLHGLPAETELIHRLRSRRTPLRDAVARLVSTTSDVPASIAVAVASVPLIYWRRADWRAAFLPALAMALETCVYVGAGALVNRPRPDVHRLDRDQPTSSFPSGHVGATVALAVTGGILAGELRSPWLRRLVRTAWFAYPATLAPARVYVGMHYPSDVVAGTVNGLVCGLIARAALRPGGRRSPRR